jgi:hypothetical protein
MIPSRWRTSRDGATIGPAMRTPWDARMMERRTFMALIAGGLLAAPLAAEGQRLLLYEGRADPGDGRWLEPEG